MIESGALQSRPSSPAAETLPGRWRALPVATAVGVRSVLVRAVTGVLSSVREHLALLVVIALYLLARMAWNGGEWPLDHQLLRTFARVFGLLAAMCLVPVALAFAFRAIHQHPWKFAPLRISTWRAFGREYFTVERMTGVVLGWAALSILLTLFLEWKADIGTARIPFTWDQRFMEWDRAIHFGRHPWEWLHPLLAHPTLTRAIDYFYHGFWTLVIQSALFLLVAWSSDRRTRMQFILTYAVLWMVLGTGFAYLLSSAGPVYYANVVATGVDPYLELIAYLDAVSAESALISVNVAGSLWAGLGDGTWPRVGISAMPSMHVAVTTLVAIWAWKWGRLAGILGLACLIAVLLGSVHLAWHYAIDAYLSLAATLGTWTTVGWYVRLTHWPGTDATNLNFTA